MSAPLFFADVEDAEIGSELRIDGDEGHHAAAVRRLRVGEAIHLTDGAGTLLHAEVATVARGVVTVGVTHRIEVPAPVPRLTVVQALARGGRDEQAVEAMTEVGVDHVVGWEAARTVARWTDRTRDKWRSTSRAAVKQSRRAWCPQVTGPVSTSEVAALCRAADLAVVLHESATDPLSGLRFPELGEIVIVVGPEGGIDDREISVLADAGGHVVQMGGTVLRSSTAGVAALAVICAATRWAKPGEKP